MIFDPTNRSDGEKEFTHDPERLAYGSVKCESLGQRT